MKPRIKRARAWSADSRAARQGGVMWRCSTGDGWVGYGETPAAAYLRWWAMVAGGWIR